MENIINLKSLRENMQKYAQKIEKGRSFIVFKRSKPLFRISPVDESLWEEIIDFTRIKKEELTLKNY